MGRGIGILAAALLCLAVSAAGAGDASPRARFVPRGEAVVRDADTGLEWTRRDDGAGLPWSAAAAYCRSLAIGDARGWRLPEIGELRRLYGTAAGTPCGRTTCAIDPAFALGSPYVWSATARGAPNARTYLDFQFGTELSPSITPRLVRRVLCVREGNPGETSPRRPARPSDSRGPVRHFRA